jgi:hypothetical protein
MNDCKCDDDMTEDGHSPSCENGVTRLRANSARLTARVKVLEEALRWLNDWLESSRENVDEARDGMARVRAALAAKEET